LLMYFVSRYGAMTCHTCQLHQTADDTRTHTYNSRDTHGAGAVSQAAEEPANTCRRLKRVPKRDRGGRVPGATHSDDIVRVSRVQPRAQQLEHLLDGEGGGDLAV
jgi:hypothetical protein